MLNPEVWSKFLSQLSVRTAATAPNLATCPKCLSTRLVFYRDTHLPSQRFWCRGCERAGDILDLVAWLRNIPVKLASADLQTLCPEARLDPQSLKLIQGNSEIAGAAAAANQRLLGSPPKIRQSPGAATLAKSLRLPLKRQLNWLDNTLGRVCGYATTDEIETNLRLKEPGSSSRAINRNHHKFLTGKNGSAFVFPLQTLPGLTTSYFLMTGSASNVEAHLHLLDYSGTGNSPGYLAEPAMLGSLSPMVLVPSYRLAARMHFRWGTVSAKSCPFVGLSDNPRRLTTDLQILARRPVTIWSMCPNAITFRYAAKLNARVTIAGPRELNWLSVVNWVNDEDPLAVSERIHRDGKPWYEVLAKYVSILQPTDTVDLISGAQLNQNQLAQVRECLPKKYHQTFDDLVSNQWSNQVVSTSRGLVEQRDSGWYHCSNDRETLILDSPFRIDQLVCTAEPEYQITTKYRGREHQVRVARREFDASPLPALNDAMIAAGIGPISYDPNWNRHARHIAMQIFPTKLVAPKPVGYEASSETFRFSNATVDRRTGIVEPCLDPVRGEWFPRGDASPVEPKHLASMDEARVLRDTLVAYVAQQLAKANGQTPVISVCEGGLATDQTRVGLAVLGGPEGTQPASSLSAESNKQTRMKQYQDGHLWFSGDMATAAWFAAQRPVIFIPGAHSSIGTLKADIVQRIALQLIGRAVQITDAASLIDATEQAWTQWLVEAGVRRQTMALKEQTLLSSLVETFEQLITSGNMSVRSTATKEPPDMTLWYEKPRASADDHKPAGFFFTVRTLSNLWKDRGLKPLDFKQLLDVLCCEQFFRGQRVRGLQPCWGVALDAFTHRTRELVREGTIRTRTA